MPYPLSSHPGSAAGGRGRAHVNWNASGKVVFRDKPFYAGTIEATVSNLHLNCPSNYPGDISAWADPKAGGDPYNGASGNITFGCDWALDNDAMYILNSGVIDLNGMDTLKGESAVVAPQSALILED